uniref:Uncharacterized protein n=1 Tax=Leviviridae sp. TaxID=2027243 RepID=A0A514CYP7_9VIRU|nr:MAG: hypothetical protein H2BulkLitter11909_000002 [Leviviridae sp.]
MRSSPSFLVVNRSGLGFHVTMERFRSELTSSGPPRLRGDSGSQEIADQPKPDSRFGRKNGFRVILLALIATVQALVYFLDDVVSLGNYIF